MFRFLRKLVILNECEGSQECTELRYLTLAPAGVGRWFAKAHQNIFSVFAKE